MGNMAVGTAAAGVITTFGTIGLATHHVINLSNHAIGVAVTISMAIVVVSSVVFGLLADYEDSMDYRQL